MKGGRYGDTVCGHWRIIAHAVCTHEICFGPKYDKNTYHLQAGASEVAPSRPWEAMFRVGWDLWAGDKRRIAKNSSSRD